MGKSFRVCLNSSYFYLWFIRNGLQFQLFYIQDRTLHVLSANVIFLCVSLWISDTDSDLSVLLYLSHVSGSPGLRPQNTSILLHTVCAGLTLVLLWLLWWWSSCQGGSFLWRYCGDFQRGSERPRREEAGQLIQGSHCSFSPVEMSQQSSFDR